jgi:MYXO-CTERM domain-containing protein
LKRLVAIGGMIALGVFPAAPAQAQDFITQIGPDLNLNMIGGWPRVFPDRNGDGWHFLWATGGNFHRVPMTDNYEVVDFNRHSLTPIDELKDHAITACPQGGYLHIASANLETPNDTAYAFRYNDDFDLLAWSVLEERVEDRDHNDMPVACGPPGDLTVFGIATPGNAVLSTFFEVQEDATGVVLATLPDVPRTAGLTLRWEPETKNLLVFEVDNSTHMDITRLDRNLQILETHSVQVMGDTDRGKWPQGSLRIGDYYMLSYVVQGYNSGWAALAGNIWVAVLDREFNVLQTEKVTQNTPPDGGMTPGLARRGDTVLVVYDKSVVSHLVELKIDLDAFGVTDGDTGGYWETGLDTGGEDTGDSGGETGVPEETGDSSGETGESVDTAEEEERERERERERKGTLPMEICACKGSSTSGSLGMLAFVAFIGRRRRNPGIGEIS